jgi:TfoX/Sxy family transcriptional regulator of competence genes
MHSAIGSSAKSNPFKGSPMAFDPGLAQRVREVVGDRPGVTERQMFGGIAFLVDGKMFVGIHDSSLMARVGPERHQDALAMLGVRVMDFTGRPMRGYAYVDPAALAEDKDLNAWVLWCLQYVAALPAKADKPRKPAK